MEALEGQLADERRVAELAGEFLGLDVSQLDAGLARGLELSARLAGADRASLLSLPEPGEGEPVYLVWAADAERRQPSEWPARTERFSWAFARLRAGEIVHAPRVSALPDEAAAERAALLARGVRSYLAVPMRVGERLIGCLEFECAGAERAWGEPGLTRLRLIAQLFASALRRKYAETARARSEDRLRILAAVAPDAICEFSRDGRLLYVSPGIDHILGYAPEEILAQTDLGLIHAEDRSRMQTVIAALWQSDQPATLVVRARHRSGDLRWLEGEGRRFETGQGELRLAAVVRDVTERMTRKADLEERLELETLIATLSREFIGPGIEELDEGIRHALGAAASIAGADRSYLISTPAFGGGELQRFEWLAPGSDQRSPMPDDMEETRAFSWFRRQIFQGQIVSVPRVEALPDAAAGERSRLLERGVKSYLAIPVRSGATLMGVLGFESTRRQRDWAGRDQALLRLVAELFTSALRRKRHEALQKRTQSTLELQLAHEKRIAELSRHFLDLEPERIDHGIREHLEVLAEVSEADHIMLLFFDGIEASRATAYDWYAEHVPLHSRRGAPLSGERFLHAEAILVKGGVYHVPSLDSLPLEAEAERADLERRGVKAQLGVPLLSERGLVGLLGVECTTREKEWSQETITLLRLAAEILASALRRKRSAEALRESQAQLVQAQKMEAVGTLAGGIAHDFNNQLAVMLGNVHYVLDNLAEGSEVADAMGDIRRAAEHCAQLTQGLLTFSRRSPVQSRPVDVERLVDDVRDLVSPLLPAPIRFDSRVEGELEPVLGDATQLQQVVINLVVNARDAMPAGGRLMLRARVRDLAGEDLAALGLEKPGRYVEILVKDDGCGMTGDVASRIFEPFFTTKEVGRGTGLGLATAYGIVQQCGGAIHFETALGAGSTFRVVLPTVPAQELEREAETRPVRLALSARVLLVEDEPAVRRVIARMLRARGVEVIEASNGREGLRVARSEQGRIDVLVTDLTMPLLGGAELARRLASEQPSLPVLFLSGYADDEVEMVVGELDRARFLQKPFGEEALLRSLRELLEPGA